MKVSKTIFACAALTMCLQGHASTTVPNTFSSGQPASASQVNANFTTLTTAIDNLASRLDKVEGSQHVTEFDIPGTYNLMMLDTQVGTAHVLASQTVATVELTSGNNVTFTCATHREEEVTPNAMYGVTTNGVMDTAPFKTTTNSSCAGVLASSTTWSFNTSTKKVTLAGTNVELMPLGRGMLIGTEGLFEATPPTANFNSSLLILVRKQ
jgi:hypothetical protein